MLILMFIFSCCYLLPASVSVQVLNDISALDALRDKEALKKRTKSLLAVDEILKRLNKDGGEVSLR